MQHRVQKQLLLSIQYCRGATRLSTCVVCPRSRPTQRNTAYLIAIMFILRVTLRCGASLPWRIDTIDLSQRARAEQLACGRGQLERLRPLNRNIAAAVAVAALFVLVSSITTASTGRSLIRRGSCLPCGEHVTPTSCAPVAAVVSCCLTSRREQARFRFAGTQLAEVLVSCSPSGYLLVRRRVGLLPRHATVRACPCVLVCVSGEMEVPVLTGYVEHSVEHTA